MNNHTGQIEYDFAMHDDRVRAHYAHAIEKHPYFCDWVAPKGTDADIKLKIARQLEWCRDRLRAGIERGMLGWDDLLDCEMWEVFEALANGDKAHAVEELYDMIAVCLRTIDVLEGRQKLGKPEEVGK